MKALVFDGTLALREIPAPKPRPGEALVKVTMAGICNTDVEISRGYMGFQGVPGHEFVGIVEQSPDPDQRGARVVGEINAGCGECPLCRRGLQRHCPHRTVLGILARDGCFAEYLTLPAQNLVVVPESLPDEKAVFTEPLAAAMEILEQVHVEPDQRVLVVGDGKLGLLAAMVLRLTGCRLTVVGKHADRMRLLDLRGVAFRGVDELGETDEQFDIVIEASGNPSGWDLAVQRVRPRGTLVLKSTYQGPVSFNPAALVINEISVIGSRCGVFGPALRIMEQGLIDPTGLISRIVPFDRAEEAFRLSQESGVLKVLLRF